MGQSPSEYIRCLEFFSGIGGLVNYSTSILFLLFIKKRGLTFLILLILALCFHSI